jgi:3-phenylpropionate/trans-cinnamate dioxygenase ferredoxin reductase subunit
VRVTKLDRTMRTLTLDDQRRLTYDKLILATGSRPRPLTVSGLDAQSTAPANLFYLRTLTDVDAMRRHFVSGARLLIVGAGYIGLEVAAVAIKAGLQVTVLENQSRVLGRVAASAVSAFFEQLHSDAGVKILVNTLLTQIQRDVQGNITSVSTGDGNIIDVDLVLAGVGVIPNCELAQDAGLAIDNGIVVDATMQTSDPDIWAIGDCANHPHPVYQRRVRLESVPNALEQARIVAACIAGKPPAPVSIPWFWSDQYELKLQMAGLSQGHDRVVMRGSADAKSFIIFYLKDNVVISADCLNRPQERCAPRIWGIR